MTQLCELAYKYKTDKCKRIKHPYTQFYYDLLNGSNIKKVLELGIGDGGSLRMWRDFFPNADIYGIDIKKKSIGGKRIKTYICDEIKEKDLLRVIKRIGADIDLFIDDASHKVEDQIATCKILRPILKKAIYIIEDVSYPQKLQDGLPYKVEIPVLKDKKYNDDRLAYIRK